MILEKGVHGCVSRYLVKIVVGLQDDAVGDSSEVLPFSVGQAGPRRTKVGISEPCERKWLNESIET